MKCPLLREGMVFTLLMAVLGCAPLPERCLAFDGGGSAGSEEAEQHEVREPVAETLPIPRLVDEDAVAPCPPELRQEEEDGPDGLTLDAAIERLVGSNTELTARFQDIPKARADVLTAGLRNDPVVFLTASPIPYGRFSPQRPGATSYDITIVQSLDLNGKHKANKLAAQKLIPVLEARFQDAVRHKIDELYIAYVNVLATRAVRETVRADLDRLTEAGQKARDPARQEKRSATEITRVSLRRASAKVALQRVEATLAQARRDLGDLLAMSPDQAAHLRVRGALRDCSPPPADSEELIQLALRARPDLAARRLSVERADAEVRREQADALEDFFLFYSPYQATDLSPQNKQSATSWEVGILLPMPFFNRNQGEIARARANAVQRRIEVEKEEQEVIDEVRRAATEYAVSRRLVRRYEREVLPGARKVRDDTYREFLRGEKNAAAFLSAQKDYAEIVLVYLEALVRHRRGMLRLNTTVGQRILP